MKQRSNFSITYLILETIDYSEPTGISKTKIMQNVMLNYKRVNTYCAQMVEAGLLSYNAATHAFHITDKGRIVLRNSAELSQLISHIGDLINKYRFSHANYHPVIGYLQATLTK